MENSWIKIYRAINKHWIWENSDYLKWWLDILLEVNFKESKTLIGAKTFTCNRGEKLYSIDTWAKRWGTNKSKARRFLKLLESDNMIELKSETKTTRLTVCNYEGYQLERNDNEPQMNRKRIANEPQVNSIEEGKKDNKVKKDKNIPALEEFMNHGISKVPDVDRTHLRLKYESWVENGWKDGYNKPIKNWKSKLTNTVGHLPKKKNEPTSSGLKYFHKQ